MSSRRSLRSICLALCLTLAAGAQAETRAKDKDWVSTVVTRIGEAERLASKGAAARGSVTIRVRIAADGALDGVSLDEGSGSAAIDERAIRAARAASPFRPPPARLLTLEGYTELSFPLRLDGKRIR